MLTEKLFAYIQHEMMLSVAMMLSIAWRNAFCVSITTMMLCLTRTKAFLVPALSMLFCSMTCRLRHFHQSHKQCSTRVCQPLQGPHNRHNQTFQNGAAQQGECRRTALVEACRDQVGGTLLREIKGMLGQGVLLLVGGPTFRCTLLLRMRAHGGRQMMQVRALLFWAIDPVLSCDSVFFFVILSIAVISSMMGFSLFRS